MKYSPALRHLTATRSTHRSVTGLTREKNLSGGKIAALADNAFPRKCMGVSIGVKGTGAAASK